MSEVDEVRRRYVSRDDRLGLQKRLWDDFTFIMVQERQAVLFRALRESLGDRDLRCVSALDVGCGAGGNLLHFLELGFRPDNLVGVELMTNRVQESREKLPDAVRIYEGDISETEFGSEKFDIVQQWTVFSSILSDDLQEKIARKMWECLKPGGIIIWYDFVYNNPWNKEVRGVSLARVRSLFRSEPIVARRVTLAPPIGRRAAALSPTFCKIIGLFPFLKSHVLLTIKKPR